MTIEQEDTIVHPFILRQFLHNTASRRISQDGRSQKFHLGELGHLDFWEQFVEVVDYAREFSRCKANVVYLGLFRVNYEAYPIGYSLEQEIAVLISHCQSATQILKKLDCRFPHGVESLDSYWLQDEASAQLSVLGEFPDFSSLGNGPIGWRGSY